MKKDIAKSDQHDDRYLQPLDKNNLTNNKIVKHMFHYCCEMFTRNFALNN